MHHSVLHCGVNDIQAGATGRTDVFYRRVTNKSNLVETKCQNKNKSISWNEVSVCILFLLIGEKIPLLARRYTRLDERVRAPTAAGERI